MSEIMGTKCSRNLDVMSHSYSLSLINVKVLKWGGLQQNCASLVGNSSLSYQNYTNFKLLKKADYFAHLTFKHPVVLFYGESLLLSLHTSLVEFIIKIVHVAKKAMRNEWSYQCNFKCVCPKLFVLSRPKSKKTINPKMD